MSGGGVCVLVVGDVAHSPRMCYHAASLATAGHSVFMVGHVRPDAAPLSVAKHAAVYRLARAPALLWRVPARLGYVLRALWTAVCLLWLLLAAVPRYHSLLVQNPPGVPALLVAWLACRVRGARLLIDWHNYTHSVLALSGSGDGGAMVRVARWLEFWCGRRADAGLCVTHAMRADLQRRGVTRVVTLHDRPAARFSPVSLTSSHELFERLSAGDGPLARASAWLHAGSAASSSCVNVDDVITPFTEQLPDGSVRRRADTGLLVSSTSWTLDEDFSLLERALNEYEQAAEAGQAAAKRLPRLVCVVTGRGPLRRQFECDIQRRAWRHVHVVTGWLSEQDYALLLASADLGVSLHRSASGLDFPMKVVDMMGAGLVVAALQFACIDELVQHACNGLVFDSAQQLAAQMIEWFSRRGCDEQRRLRDNVDAFRRRGWHENWRSVAEPLFN